MSDITKEYLDRAISGLAGKDDIVAIKDDVKTIKAGMFKLATSEELAEIKTTLANIQTTVHSHTTALDGFAKSVKILLDDKSVATARI